MMNRTHVSLLSRVVLCFSLYLGSTGLCVAETPGTSFELYPSPSQKTLKKLAQHAPPEKEFTAPPPQEDIKQQHNARRGGTFSIGAGFSGQEGFIASARLAHDSLFGIEGLKLSLATRMSGSQQLARMAFGIGMTPSSRFFAKMTLDGAMRAFSPEEDGLQSRSFGGTLTAGMRLGKRWSLALGYKLSNESLKNSDLLGQTSLQLPKGTWNTPLWDSALKLTLKHTPARPRDEETGMLTGVHFTLTGQTSNPLTGSAFNYTKLDTSLKYGVSLGHGFHLVMEAGGGVMMGEDTAIPFVERYRYGGIHGIQSGLPSLGPQMQHNEQTFALGGTGLLYARSELRIPIIRKFGLYLFAGAEAAAVFSQYSAQTTPLKVAASPTLAANLGLLWKSPIGPLRFQFSLPIVRPPGTSPLLFNFSTGNSF